MADILLLPTRAGRSHRHRRADVRVSVHALRQAVAIDREDLIAELDWLAFRARSSGLCTAATLLSSAARGLRMARAHELTDAMVRTIQQEGGAR